MLSPCSESPLLILRVALAGGGPSYFIAEETGAGRLMSCAGHTPREQSSTVSSRGSLIARVGLSHKVILFIVEKAATGRELMSLLLVMGKLWQGSVDYTLCMRSDPPFSE